MGQPPIPPTPPGTDLTGKTVIVTGGNAGLGLEAARQFLALKASRVIIAVRSEAKGREAVAELKADPTVQKVNPDAIVEAFPLDLDDFQSGADFVRKVKNEVPQLDILLNNGGTNVLRYSKSASGHEHVMQVNVYTHFLVSLGLLPLLISTAERRGAATHLSFVGSSMQNSHSLAKKPLAPDKTIIQHWDDQKTYNPMTRYQDTKFMVNVLVRGLAKMVGQDNNPPKVIVNQMCPGLVQTGFDKDLPAWLKPLMYVYRKVSARHVSEGARTLIYASAVVGPEAHGKFLANNVVQSGEIPFLDEAAGKSFQEKVWKELVTECSKYDPELSKYA
ncbi:putative carbonyl reductase [Xylariaceae sp. FL0594]|nr:putative carbonyl reductase [Xylariaceae sp. FL0594]